MIRRLGRFSIREWKTTINQVIDALERQAPRSAPGTKAATSYKGTRRSASGGGPKQQTTQQTIPVARWQ